MEQTQHNPYAIMQATEYGTALAEVAEDLVPVFAGDQYAIQQFIGALYLHFRKTPKLQACTVDSIKATCIEIALGGLDIRNDGEAYLIPFDNKQKDANGKDILVDDPADPKKKKPLVLTECTLLTGYKGRRKQVLTHEAVIDVWADLVRKNDRFKWHGKIECPEHEYDPFADDAERGPIVGYYAVVMLAGGRYRAEAMSKTAIEKHRDQFSPAAKSTFWTRNFDHMAMKTVMRQVCDPRVIPMTAAVRRSVDREERLIKDVTNTRQPDYLPPAEGTPRQDDTERANDLYGEPTDPTAPPAPVNAATGEVPMTEEEHIAARKNLLDQVCTAIQEVEVLAKDEKYKTLDADTIESWKETIRAGATVEQLAEIRQSVSHYLMTLGALPF